MSARADAQPVNWRGVLSLRWFLTTLLVLAAAAVMARLGIWQLDRLSQRRDLNARTAAGMAQPPLSLNQASLPDLTAMEFRSALVAGQYDFEAEVLLRNQFNDGQPGYHLLTPLRIDGSGQEVLVDRGWIPLDGGHPDLSQYRTPGTVSVQGQMRRGQAEPTFGGVPDPALAPGQTRLAAWNFINLERIGRQLAAPLLPIYLIAAPDPGAGSLPVRVLPAVDLSEGPHESYAIQWFCFAATLLIGYPFYVRTQLRRRSA